MNLIFCSLKSFLSLFAIMRLVGMSTNNPFSILFFFLFLYAYMRLSKDSVRTTVTTKDNWLSFLAAIFFTILTLAADYTKLLQGMTSTFYYITMRYYCC